MNRIAYSVILLLLLLGNIFIIVPTTIKAQVGTEAAWLVSAYTRPDPEPGRPPVAVYLDNHCILAVINVQTLREEGIEPAHVYINITEVDVAGTGDPLLTSIVVDQETGKWIPDDTGVEYYIIRDKSNPDRVLLAIKIQSINSTVLQKYYGKPVYLMIGSPQAHYYGTGPHVPSANRFLIYKIPEINWGDYVKINGVDHVKAKYSSFISINFTLPDEIRELYANLTNTTIENVTFYTLLEEANFTEITIGMFNVRNYSDSDIILNITYIRENITSKLIELNRTSKITITNIEVRDNATIIYYWDNRSHPPDFKIATCNVTEDNTTLCTIVTNTSKYLGEAFYNVTPINIVINGSIQQFAPYTIYDINSPIPRALYGLSIKLRTVLNMTNITMLDHYNFSLKELSDCLNIINNTHVGFTLGLTAELDNTRYNKYVEIWSSAEAIYYERSLKGKPDLLNPGDNVTIRFYNIPMPYNRPEALYSVRFYTDYTTITAIKGYNFSYVYINDTKEPNSANGTLTFNITIPDGEWGGLEIRKIEFEFNINDKLITINETPGCKAITIENVYPYFEVYVLRNLPEDIVECTDKYISRKFVLYNYTDYTVAPGDYVLIKAYGYITEGGLHVYLNDTIELEKILEVTREDDKTLPPGRALLVVKMVYPKPEIYLYDEVITIDVSESMEGNKDRTKNATYALIDLVPVNGSWAIGLMKFTTEAQNLTDGLIEIISEDNKTDLRIIIDELLLRKHTGPTNLSRAIYDAVDFINRHRRLNTIRVIVLVTDGDPHNITSIEEIRAAIEYARRNHIFVIGIFVGDPTVIDDVYASRKLKEVVGDEYFINASAFENITEELPMAFMSIIENIRRQILELPSIICPCENNELVVVGSKYIYANRYIADHNVTIGYRDDLWKVLVNPLIYYSFIDREVYLNQTRPRLFEVFYDLVEDPEAPGNDTFIEDVYEESTVVEIIGINNTYVTLYLNATYPHNESYRWFDIMLNCGYGIVDLKNTTIPFIALGLYIFTVQNDTTFIAPEALKNCDTDYHSFLRVHPNIDIDVVPTDDTEGKLCDDIIISVVGNLPEDNVTFIGDAYVDVTAEGLEPGPPKHITVTFTIETDYRGKGTITINGLEFYTEDELRNDTKDYLDSKIFGEVKESIILNFTVTYDANFTSFTNDTFTVTWYDPNFWWASTAETKFVLIINGIVNVTGVRDIVLWNVSVRIPRNYVEVSVPETLLPGDNITIQIIVYKSDDHSPWNIWDVYAPFWISVRLVDLTASSKEGRLVVLYGGWIRFDDTHTRVLLPNGKYAVIQRIREDVDNDGNYEIVFYITLPAPLLTHDVTYRVDVNVTLAYKLNQTLTEYNQTLCTEKCVFLGNYTGLRYWTTNYTYTLYGEDHQLTTVLGLLEAKLDSISQDVVTMIATIKDVNKTIVVDLPEFLRLINGSLARIENNTITLIQGQARIEADLKTAIDLLTNISDVLNVTIAENLVLIQGVIEEAVDDIIANTTIQLTMLKSDIKNLINLRVDELEIYMGSNFTMINATLSDMRNKLITIKNELSEVTITLNETTATLIAGVLALQANMSYVVDKIAEMVNQTHASLELIQDSIDGVATLIARVNDTLVVKLTGAVDDINVALDDMKNYMSSQFDSMSSTLTNALNNMKNTLTNTSNTLISTVSTKLDNTKSELTNEIDSATDTLRTKIDTLDRKQSESYSSLNGTITLFSSIILLLEVIIIALVGYSLVRRPVG